MPDTIADVPGPAGIASQPYPDSRSRAWRVAREAGVSLPRLLDQDAAASRHGVWRAPLRRPDAVARGGCETVHTGAGRTAPAM